MSVVVVLSDPPTERKRVEIARALERFGECVALSESSYAINTELSSEEIAAALKAALGMKAGLHAIAVKRSYRGPAPAKIRQWLMRDG